MLSAHRRNEKNNSEARLVSTLKNLGFPGDNAAVQRALNYIRDHIRDGMAGRRVLLILDDWHFADFPEFDAFLERMAREGIPGLTLLLLSRSRPAFAVEDLRLKGFARVFGQDLLTFSEKEAVEYFARHGVSDALASKAAWKACEGWPAALWLALEAYKEQPGAASAQAARSTGAVHAPFPVDAASLLESVVFPHYSAEEQRLLMQCSVLESFSAEQAALVTDNPAAPECLRRLLEDNALLSHDPASGLYRLHSLFRTFLTEKLDGATDVDNAALYGRAGESCLLSGDLLQAARFFHRAGRDEDLLCLLDIFTLPQGNLLLFFAADTVLPLVQSIPWRVRAQRPVAYLAFIYFYFAECDNRSRASESCAAVPAPNPANAPDPHASARCRKSGSPRPHSPPELL